ncbi:FAD-dependent oxidoreductase [Geomonas propionica]|uniref:FAD-dependent oxidoreductase n=1 Tax=Geomonas propionica TaxID=2798582 RepID=A0ABS0YSA4_9BACT|nr:FAD-dependent oxidoreductase [Geomonas propionica]MBJ6800800.1 FAD-dependent oxidoreductase [Geomonas propionica]
MKCVIIGGIAAGLSAASQIKRQSPEAEVVVLEKSGDVSYAACGMPYNLFFRDKPVEKLYALPLETIRSERGVDYRLYQEVTRIDAEGKEVEVTDLQSGKSYSESYDFLVYATGNKAIRLDYPGFDDRDVFYFRTLEDTRRAKEFLYQNPPAKVLLVGAGYTNLEVADVLTNLKLTPVIIEKAPVILPSFCEEVREKVVAKALEKGIELFTGVDVEEKAGRQVKTSAGTFEADMVVVAAGARPNTALFAAAGGELGVAGAVKVDRYLRTNLDGVFSGGDCAEHYVRQLGLNSYFPLGPAANKQGRVIGHNICNPDRMTEFWGIDQTAVFKFFDYTIATTGLSERQLQTLNKNVVKVVVDGPTRGEFPGGGTIRIVLLCEKGSGLLLGAQMIGEDVVAKRLDVLATAIYKKMTVFEIAELDLSYSPPYAPVWDPILVAANVAVKKV